MFLSMGKLEVSKILAFYSFCQLNAKLCLRKQFFPESEVLLLKILDGLIDVVIFIIRLAIRYY